MTRRGSPTPLRGYPSHESWRAVSQVSSLNPPRPPELSPRSRKARKTCATPRALGRARVLLRCGWSLGQGNRTPACQAPGARPCGAVRCGGSRVSRRVRTRVRSPNIYFPPPTRPPGAGRQAPQFGRDQGAEDGTPKRPRAEVQPASQRPALRSAGTGCGLWLSRRGVGLVESSWRGVGLVCLQDSRRTNLWPRTRSYRTGTGSSLCFRPCRPSRGGPGSRRGLRAAVMASGRSISHHTAALLAQ